MEDSVAEIRLGMEGWLARVYLPDEEERVEATETINATLNANHTLLVNLATLDVHLPDGSYVGRWSFHLTAAEVAIGKAELNRQWYGGIVREANVTVTNDFLADLGDGTLGDPTEDYLEEAYGVSTFVLAETSTTDPFPSELESYVPVNSAGWEYLYAMGLFYDTSSFTLLFGAGGGFFSDLFYQLYGILWQRDGERVAQEVVSSFIRLVDTNLISTLPSDGETGEPDEPVPDPGAEGDDGGGGTTEGTESTDAGLGVPTWVFPMAFLVIGGVGVFLILLTRPSREGPRGGYHR